MISFTTYKNWLQLNELQSFERNQRDPLKTLDIGQSYLKKIRKVRLEVYDSYDSIYEILDLNTTDIIDDDVEEKCIKDAQELLSKYRNSKYNDKKFYISIIYYDKNDVIIKEDEIR